MRVGLARGRVESDRGQHGGGACSYFTGKVDMSNQAESIIRLERRYTMVSILYGCYLLQIVNNLQRCVSQLVVRQWRDFYQLLTKVF